MHPRTVLTIGNFFSAAHFFLVIYIVTPYLALYMPASQTGLVVAFGAVITLTAFPFMAIMVRTLGAKRLAIVLSFIQAITLFGLALSPGIALAILGIAVTCALSPLIAYQLDLLLEAATTDEALTGRVRTLFLTAGSVALILSPLVTGFLLGDTFAYERVFLAASLSLTPFITLLLLERLPASEPPQLERMHVTARRVWKDTDLRAAGLGYAVLQFFFHLAPLYIPLYLHTVLGFPWSDLGWIFAVMLLPFVFIEYPAGYVADRWLGDKELLIAGFLLTGAGFGAIALITASTSLWIIALILIVSRIGAAMVEAMAEGHFFRRVTAQDANTISLFRMMRPAGALVAPIFATLLLLSGNYVAFFLVSGGVIAALGIFVTIPLRDVR